MDKDKVAHELAIIWTTTKWKTKDEDAMNIVDEGTLMEELHETYTSAFNYFRNLG